MHNVDVGWFDEHADRAADIECVVVLNHQLVTLVSIDIHLVVDTFKGTRLNNACKLCVLSIGNDVYVLRTNNNIDLLVLAEALIYTLERVTYEFYFAVVYHLSVQNVTLSDKIGNKRIDRLVVDVGWCAYLLNFTLAHHNYRVAQC